MKHILRYMLFGLAAVLLVLAVAAWWLLGTGSGARWALQQVSRITPVTIETPSVEGRLWGELRIEGLRASWPNGSVRVRHLRLDWEPRTLLIGRVGVNNLVIEGARIQDNRAETPAGPPGLHWPDRLDIPLPPVRVRSLHLQDIHYQRLEQQPIRIDEAKADFRLSRRAVSISGLALAMPEARVNGRVSVELDRPRLEMDAAINPANPMAGMDEFRIRAELDPAKAPVQLAGTVDVAGFSGSGKMIEAGAVVAVTDRSLLFRNMKVSRPGRRGSLTGQGEVIFAAENPAFDGKLILNDIDLSNEVPWLNTVSGSLGIKGNTREYAGTLSVMNRGTGWKTGGLEAAFRGSTESLSLTSLTGNWLEGTLRGSARADWKTSPSFSASFKVRGMNPGAIDPKWAGSINMNLNTSGTLPEKQQPQGKLSLHLLNSSLRGRQLTGDVEAALSRGSIRIGSLIFKGSGFTVKASGDLAKRIDFSARVSDLSLLYKDAEGRARAQGWFRKKGELLSGSITANGSTLAAAGVKAASADLSARIEAGRKYPFSLKLTVRDIAYTMLHADSLDVTASGTQAEHDIRVSLKSSIATIRTRLTGAFREDAWNGTIVRFSGTDTQGEWSLREPASLAVSADRFFLSPLVLTGAGGEHFALEAKIGMAPLSGTFLLDWRELDISRANTWVTVLKVSGVTNGRLSGKVLPEGRLDVVGDASVSRGSLTRRVQGLELKAQIRNAGLSFVWRDRTLEGTASLVFAEYGRVNASLNLPLPATLPVSLDRDGPLRAALSGRIRETGMLSFLFPGLVQETRGQLALDVRVGGTWNSPDLNGTASVENAGAYFPAAGIHVTDIELHAGIKGSRITITSFSAGSGPGRIQGKAAVTLDGWSIARYEGGFQGERFQALHLPELRMLASPDIDFHGTPRKLSARGTVRVPELLIYGAPREAAVQPSGDVMIVGRQEEKEGRGMAIDLATTVILGDRVIVKAEGIDARLGGRIVLTGPPDEITGKGEIRVIEGKYSIYGVTLDIRRGRLFFAGGPIGNPTLDILALRTEDDVKAGVLVTGRLREPAISLYSEPVMPDTDVLAYIVLGHPLGQDREQASLLMRAAAALLSRGESVALQDRIKNRLGVDVVDIEAGGGEVSRSLVTIGKYLSSRLYISYGYALFSSESLFRLSYRFGKRWELESRSGETSGVDLYYTVRFD